MESQLTNVSSKVKFARIIIDEEQKIVQWFRTMAMAGIQTAHASDTTVEDEESQNANETITTTRKTIKKITFANMLSLDTTLLAGENTLDSTESAFIRELGNAVAAPSTTEGDASNNAVDHPDNAELSTGADNSDGDGNVQFRVLGDGGGLSSDILRAIQRQLQSMVDGEVGTNLMEGSEVNVENLDSAVSTIDSEEDAASSSGELNMHQLQRALFSSLQALGSSTTTTTTTTSTSPNGEVSQLVYIAVATNGAPQIRLALPVSDNAAEVSVDNLLSSDTLAMSLDNLDSMLHGARIARSDGDGSSDGNTPQEIR